MLETPDICCSHTYINPIVELKNLAQGQAVHIDVFAQKIILITDGAVHVSIENSNAARLLDKNEFIFVPMGVSLRYEAIENSAVLLIDIVEHIPECAHFRVSKRPDFSARSGSTIYALTANRYIKHFAKGLAEAIGDNMRCTRYMRVKVAEFIMLLRSYYSSEDCVRFFASILSVDMGFSEFVRINHLKFNSVSAMAAAMNMTPRKFASRFKKVFGIVPHKWVRKELARHIYADLCQSQITIKEIADKYGFSAHSNFTRYCRNTYGSSPKNIRKKLDT